MFPIQDINHRVIGFGGRVMGKGEPKYLNSPETPVLIKEETSTDLTLQGRRVPATSFCVRVTWM